MQAEPAGARIAWFGRKINWSESPIDLATLMRETARAAAGYTDLELVSTNPARTRELVVSCLPPLDYLIVNDHENGACAVAYGVGRGQSPRIATEREASGSW